MLRRKITLTTKQGDIITVCSAHGETAFGDLNEVCIFWPDDTSSVVGTADMFDAVVTAIEQTIRLT